MRICVFYLPSWNQLTTTVFKNTKVPAGYDKRDRETECGFCTEKEDIMELAHWHQVDSLCCRKNFGGKSTYFGVI